jgi:hypothetical protein
MIGGCAHISLSKFSILNILDSDFKNCFASLYRQNSKGGGIYVDLKLSQKSIINIRNNNFINNIAQD